MSPVAPQQGDEDARTTTPLDHPLFLPVLFTGCAVWFGYDGYLSQDEAMLEHRAFNRFGFQVLVFLALHWGYRGLCEWQHRRESPWVLPAILGLMSIWTGLQGWMSQDPFDLEHAMITRAVFPWLVFATAAYAVSAAIQQGPRRPRFTFAIAVGVPALAFAYQGFVTYAGQSEQLLWIAGAASLGLIAVWSVISQLSRRRHLLP